MDKFLDQINTEAENLANEYLTYENNKSNFELRQKILDEINVRLSILANAQTLKTSAITADFTRQMTEQSKNIDMSKIDFNELLGKFHV